MPETQADLTPSLLLQAKRTKKLGRLKYEPKRADVLLSDELPSALRQLPAPIGPQSLLAERFDSMQVQPNHYLRSKLH